MVQFSRWTVPHRMVQLIHLGGQRRVSLSLLATLPGSKKVIDAYPSPHLQSLTINETRNPEYAMSFGTYIRQKREAKGIPLNEFARQLDISPAYWSRIERDREKPPKDELIKRAAELVGEPPDDAFIEASRLPPDLVDKVGEVVRLYRKGTGNA